MQLYSSTRQNRIQDITERIALHLDKLCYLRLDTSSWLLQSPFGVASFFWRHEDHVCQATIDDSVLVRVVITVPRVVDCLCY